MPSFVRVSSTRVAGFLVALVALGALFGCTGSTQTCTLLACENGAQLTREVTVTADEASALVIEVCRNSICVTGTKSTDQGNPSSINYAFTGAIPTFGYVVTTASGGHEVQLHIGDAESETKNMNDGDVYTVKITKPGETSPLVNLTSTASYASSEPNGPNCGPACKSTSL